MDWTTGLIDFHLKRTFRGSINEVQWREIAPPVETLGLSWFYWPRLSTTPTIVAQSTGKNETELLLYV